MENKELVLGFIANVWNRQEIEHLVDYVSDRFIDHSLPLGFPEGLAGTQMWIAATGKSFRHRTIVEDILAEGNQVCIRIKMELHHIGEWRGYAATGVDITTSGYRFFELANGRIVQQWALIDGNRIEQAIAGNSHGCRLPA
ncbi:hypothetical protein GCM10011386_35180 [Parapedobacter defluvii]|uniref:Ester cyclase n=1 Tax=Parapedobacter defluvii TaxID=2045106 RepID=A0ABQ1MG98_9SPHI|nr:ester cyclase [Parapedobacter defluvii]GGC40061.1 hypothetical protein GCM10011386_35180 [Parapedobacter defluvii]